MQNLGSFFFFFAHCARYIMEEKLEKAKVNIRKTKCKMWTSMR